MTSNNAFGVIKMTKSISKNVVCVQPLVWWFSHQKHFIGRIKKNSLNTSFSVIFLLFTQLGKWHQKMKIEIKNDTMETSILKNTSIWWYAYYKHNSSSAITTYLFDLATISVWLLWQHFKQIYFFTLPIYTPLVVVANK